MSNNGVLSKSHDTNPAGSREDDPHPALRRRVWSKLTAFKAGKGTLFGVKMAFSFSHSLQFRQLLVAGPANHWLSE
jgi:hypothetical protein